MITGARIAVFGADDLRGSVEALGFEVQQERADVALVDVRETRYVAEAASLPADLPRVIVGDETHRGLTAVLGLDAARFVVGSEPARIGPAIVAALPRQRRARTRALAITSQRGGTGRTLFAVNLALRLAPAMHVAVIDATGTGAAAWWLRAQPQPWSALAGLIEELTTDQLAVVAEDARPGVRVIGGPGDAPTAEIVSAVIATSVALDDIVIVDAPLIASTVTSAIRARCDRTFVVSYDDPISTESLAGLQLGDAWLIASQSSVAAVGGHDVFRALPRDEPAISAAMQSRERVGGRLGRAYEDLAELIRIDAS